MKWLRTGAIFLAACALVSCARVPRPALFPEIVTGAEKQALLDELRTQDGAVNSFRGLARGVIQQGTERAIVRYVILFKKPDMLRIETLPPNGAYALGVLAASHSGVTMLDPVNKRAYKSSDAVHAIKTALRIPVSPAQLMSYLLAMAPEDTLNDALDVRRSQTGIQLIHGDFLGYWLLDPANKHLATAQLRSRPYSAPVVTLDFKGYEQDGAFLYPHQFTITVPGEKMTATLTLLSAEFNPELNDDQFSLQIPDDYAVYQGLHDK